MNCILGTQEETDVVSIDILTFLRDMVNQTVIDLLFINNEGLEFDLLPVIAVGDLLKESGIVICQMNVEIHVSEQEDRLEYFASMMSDVLNARRFALLHWWGHQRAFFINIQHPMCVEKYLVQFFK
ncbi:unnamed protein product [Cylicostephanus goldi]|uniref:Methyltransferase FkbM domain-containing protein n=1 Tax=Cylicostephanus goldi TaxID=71465 RepID=A0A3P6TIB8_CYLGO|nr:unnamed protein product [Cylicostephanus goldi]